MTDEQLDDEATRATGLLKARTVAKVWRHRPGEIGIAFTDGTRLFVNAENRIEISVTGPDPNRLGSTRAQESELSAKPIAVVVIVLATVWQIYLIALLFRVAPTMQHLLADLGAELSLPTRTLLGTYRWSPSVPLLSVLLTIDIMRRRRVHRGHAVRGAHHRCRPLLRASRLDNGGVV